MYAHDVREPQAANYPPIMFFTMGKVGSISLVHHLRTQYPNVFGFHEYILEDSRDMASINLDLGGQERKNALIREFLNSNEVNDENPALVFSLIRDPGARIISSFFFSLEIGLMDHWDSLPLPPNKVRPKLDPVDIPSPVRRNLYGFASIRNADPQKRHAQTYSDTIVHKYDWRWHLNWFDEQFLPLIGIDVFAHPFPKDKGWRLIQEKGIKVMLIRTEDLDQVWPEINKELFGSKYPDQLKRRNTTLVPDYQFYKKDIKFPEHMLDRLYNNQQVRHFYTDSELSEFRAKFEERKDP